MIIAQSKGFLQGGYLKTIGSGAGVATGSGDQLMVIIGNLIYAVLGILGLVLLGYLLLAGFKWMTAQGEEDQVKEAKNIIKNAIIGLVIITMAFSITNYVLNRLSDITIQSTTPATVPEGSG